MALSDGGPSGLVTFVVLDDFLNDEIQEFLGEVRIEIRLLRQILEPRDLLFFPRGVGGGQVVMRLEDAHGLGVLEPLGQGKDEDRVEPVDALAVFLQQRGGACGRVSQWASPSV